MANFPLTFFDSSATSNDYGGDDVTKSLYYVIHDVNNIPIFSALQTGIDVYTFNENATADSPQRSYAILIIKNTGTNNSFLNVTGIALETEETNAGFSLVNSYADIGSTDFNGVTGIIDHAAFSGIINGNNNGNGSGGAILTGPTPICYVVLNSTSGNVEEDDFGGTARYIPIYRPVDISANTNGVTTGISAKTINGVTYPEYAAFLLKCDPTNEVNVNPSNTTERLLLNFEGFDTKIFNLRVKAFRKGALQYEQVMVDSGTVFTPAFIGNSSKNFGGVSSISFLFGTNITGANGIYGVNNIDNLVTLTNTSINMSDDLENHVIAGYYPYGYNDLSTAYTSESGNSADTKTLFVKINDSTANTGGVRLYATDETTSEVFDGTASPGTTIDNAISSNLADFTYSFGADTTLTSDQSTDTSFGGGFINAQNFIFQANQNVYLTLDKNVSNAISHYRVAFQHQEGAIDNRTPFLHPDNSQISNSSFNNWRPRLYSILVFYNEYFIDGESGETITGDRLNLFHGVYRIFSTTSTVFQNFCRLDNFDNANVGTSGLANPLADYNIKSVAYTGEDIFLRENVLGLVDSNYSAFKKDTAGQPAPQGEGNDTNNKLNTLSDGTTQSISGTGVKRVYKHAHIYDYFNLPTLTNNGVGSISHEEIVLRYNNISGLPGFYQETFDFYSANGTNILRARNIDGVQNSLINCDISNRESFEATGIKSINGTAASDPTRVFANGNDADGGPWQVYSGEQFYNTSKYKDVKLVLFFQPKVDNDVTLNGTFSQNYHETFDAIADAGFDALGRIKEETTIFVNQSGTDNALGNTQASNSNTQITQVDFKDDTMFNTGITFHLHGHFFPQHRIDPTLPLLVPIQNIDNTNDWTTATYFITEYLADSSFGSHSIDGTTRPPLTETIIGNAKQNLITTSTNTTTGLGNGHGLEHMYASVDTTNNYYYKKWPLNGSACYKYENYFKDILYKQNIDTSNNNSYGILPGPVIPGRFDGSGNAIHSCYTNTNILSTRSSTSNDTVGAFEVFIPLNFYLNSAYEVSLISVELDNPVGTASDLSSGYGDPRFIAGLGEQNVDSSGNISPLNGEYYKTNLSDSSSTADDVAPTSTLIKDCSGIGSTVMTITGGMTGLTIGMTVIAEDTSFVPRGTTIISLDANNNTATLSAVAENTSGATKKVLFDFDENNYCIWNIVRGKRGSGEDGSTLTEFPQSKILDISQSLKRTSGSANITGGAGELEAGALNSNNANAFYKRFFGNNVHTGNAQSLIGAYVIGTGILPGTKVISVNATTIQMDNAATTTGLQPIRFLHPDHKNFSTEFIENSDSLITAMRKDNSVDNISSAAATSTTVARLKKCQSAQQALGAGDIGGNRTFYSNYTDHASLTSGAPYIYFALKKTAVLANDIDSGFYYNKVRIKYCVWNRLDMYGLNQNGISMNSGTELSPVDFSSANADQLHVYEDTYLVKVQFTNQLIPNVEVSDLEGDIHANNSTINFGTLSTG